MSRIALLAVLLFASAPARALDKDLLFEHIRESYRIPDRVGFELGELTKSDVPGFKQAKLVMRLGDNRQEEMIYVSDNGRFYLMGTFRDLKTHPVKDRLSKMDLKDSAVRGSASAPVSVVEYTDFQCPYCKLGYELMRDKILKEYPDKVRWVYKSFPLTNIHPWAESAAVAVECARLESAEKFWLLHDAIFDKQAQLPRADADKELVALAKDKGVASAAFQACFDGQKTLQKVRRDVDEAGELGVNSTPTFVVNGRLVPGASYDAIKAAVERALKDGN